MARTPAINVKIPTAKVIVALEKALTDAQAKQEAANKAELDYENAMQEWKKEVVKKVMNTDVIVDNIRIGNRWDGRVNIDFDVVDGAKLKLPAQPEYVRTHYNYDGDIEDISNALRILKMTDDETISTSTYNNISRFL